MRTPCYNLDPVIEKIRKVLKSHHLDRTGAYARWIWQNKDNNRDLGCNLYGCADAANILYSIGEFPSDESERRAWTEVLQSFQDPETGTFSETTHHVLHSTAHCIAALELFDKRPLYPLTALKPYLEKEKLYELLENIRWRDYPWLDSHQGAGIFAALTITDTADSSWKDLYFDWFWNEADPETGFWRKGFTTLPDSKPLYHHMAGSFHYLFNHEAEHKPLRYPERMVDSCLSLFDSVAEGEEFGRHISFLEIDLIYCTTRAWRQCGYRTHDVKQSLTRFAGKFYDYLMSVDEDTDDDFNDLHLLFGTVCALAEIQQSIPGIYHSSHPLKLVLDRRPFI